MDAVLFVSIINSLGKREGNSSSKAPDRLLSVENEQADAGRGGQTRLARPNSQARTGTGKKTFSAISNNHGTFNARPSFSHTNYGYKVDSTITTGITGVNGRRYGIGPQPYKCPVIYYAFANPVLYVVCWTGKYERNIYKKT